MTTRKKAARRATPSQRAPRSAASAPASEQRATKPAPRTTKPAPRTTKSAPRTTKPAPRSRKSAAPRVVDERARPTLTMGTAKPMSPAALRRLPILSETRRQVPCLSCALCCSYVAVEIDGPVSVRAATDILWYLYHGGVSMYFDEDGWMVQVDTQCRHLRSDNKCGIYEKRPQMCREYDETGCEVNADELGTTLHNVEEYLAYLKQHRRRIYNVVAKNYMPGPEAIKAGPPRRIGPFQPRFSTVRAMGARS